MSHTTLVKLGGSALDQLEEMLDFVESLQETRVILVHGGGPQITTLLEEVGHQASFHQGLRVTDEVTLGVVEMVLTGQVNTKLVAALQSRGLKACGFSGVDAGTLTTNFIQDGALGFVGQTPKVKTEFLNCLLGHDYLPVLAPLSLGPAGQTLNVNADTTAAAVAVALEVDRLIFLTNVAGVLDDQGQTMSSLSSCQVDTLRESGVISSGMIPKIESALHALRGGVPQVEIRSPHSVAGTTFTHHKGAQNVSTVC